MVNGSYYLECNYNYVYNGLLYDVFILYDRIVWSNDLLFLDGGFHPEFY
jgi:hypothetical protein